MILHNSDNNMVLTGRVGSIHTGTTQTGKSYTNISVAIDRSWPKKENGENVMQDGKQVFDHKTAWFKFTCWDFASNVVKNVQVGDVVKASFHASDVEAHVFADNDGTSKASIQVSPANIVLVEKSTKRATPDVGDSQPAVDDIPVEQPMAEVAI